MIKNDHNKTEMEIYDDETLKIFLKGFNEK